VADALSAHTLEGPFPAFTDALKAARRLAITGPCGSGLMSMGTAYANARDPRAGVLAEARSPSRELLLSHGSASRGCADPWFRYNGVRSARCGVPSTSDRLRYIRRERLGDVKEFVASNLTLGIQRTRSVDDLFSVLERHLATDFRQLLLKASEISIDRGIARVE